MKQSKPFFSPKVLLTIILGVTVFYFVVAVGYYAFSEYSINRKKEQAVAKQKAEFNKLSKEEQSIRKTEDFLKGSIALVDTPERLFFAYLQRKFDLPSHFGVDGPPIDLNEHPRTYPEQIHFIARIAYPNRLVKLPLKEELDDPAKLTNVYGANCDHIPLPANFWKQMENNVKLGGYYLAHVALALQMMEDNACHLPPIADDLNNMSIDGMVKLAESPDTTADLRYESIAFLLMRGHYDLVNPEWISQIVSEQRADGTWAQKEDDSKTDFHSTILAYWSLLEYSRPNTPYEPLILRPTQINP